MKTLRLAVLLVLSLIAFVVESKAQVNPSSTYVQGYYKSNGTYVDGYYKTTPNTSNRDNYSTKPNVNPYTGKSGTIESDNKPLTKLNDTYTVPATNTTTTPLATPASSYSTPVIQTGPRGGQYYINSNGNKTYIKH